MTPGQIFGIANTIALCGWILLIVVPGRRASISGVLPAAFAAVYAVIIAIVTARGVEGGFSSLDQVATLFSNPWLLLAGWLHYLAFDLLIGSWEVRDAHERGIPHLLVVPCLLLTFLFGPAGWLLYVTMRAVFARAQRPAVSVA